MKNQGGFFEIDDKKKRIIELEKTISKNDFWDNADEAKKIMQKLNDCRKDVKEYEGLKTKYDDMETLLLLVRESQGDSGEVRETVNEITEGINELEKDFKKLILRSRLGGKFDKNNAIFTLHSGAGGTEACDWTEMLLRMYLRWAEKRGYEATVTDVLSGDEAGIKKVTFVLSGEYAFGYLKSEIGIHRLVRISPFDANKRRHTSFAACDVIPSVEDMPTVVIEGKDLRIDTYRASGKGGQHVNKTDSAVRITHLPTKTVVQCQNERSQHKNKEMAMKQLKARLFEIQQEKLRNEKEKHYNEKGDIAWGSQIRSYVFCPYTMVKDHRTGTQTGNVEAVMDGEIDDFIESYLST